MPLPIPYKVMQPIIILAALDRVVRGVQLGGVWVSKTASVTVVLFWDFWLFTVLFHQTLQNSSDEQITHNPSRGHT